MGRITIHEIEVAYELGVKVYHGQMRSGEAVDILEKEYSMNRASAADYIGNIGKILNGNVYTRTFNLVAAEYFLSKIAVEFPQDKLEAAIAAIQSHIVYYKNVSGAHLTQLAEICEKHMRNLEIKLENLEKHDEAFEDEVRTALGLSSNERRKRAAEYTRKPKSVLRLTATFVRNPFVKADVIVRANGKCEKCQLTGPFLKKKDGFPYLEVHHRIPLAENGDDSVENAIALCPNCHREAHHGVNWEMFRR